MGRPANAKFFKLTVTNGHTALAARMKERGFNAPRLARYCGYSSPSVIYRLQNGTAPWATPRTAKLIEEALDMRGLLFTEQTAKHIGLTVTKKAKTRQSIPTPRCGEVAA